MPAVVGTGRLRAPLLFALAALAAPALAGPPQLRLPVDCAPGTDCHVLRHVDHDPGPGVRDHACGTLTGDGHNGTDFALATLAEMTTGVAVRAAAAGRVRGVRDGMPDIDTTAPAAPDVSGRECGNGVAITHTDGWETRYCHLRKGSIRVRMGQRVAAGEVIGLVGMSGMASFPHLHFTVQHGDAVVDPFRPDARSGCGPAHGPGLWIEPMPYRPGGLMEAGVITRVPDYGEVTAGLPELSLTGQPAALVLWGFAFGGAAGDEIGFALTGPDGPIGEETVTLAEGQPRFFRAWGKRAPEAGFPAGGYAGRVIYRRGGVELGRREIAFTLPPAVPGATGAADAHGVSGGASRD